MASDHVAIDAYLDNLRLCGDSLLGLQRTLRLLYKVAAEFRVDINEDLEEREGCDPTKYEFLGLLFDHSNRTMDIAPHIRTKIQQIDPQHDGSLRSFLATYGLLCFASMALRIPRCDFYFATKFLRRRASARAKLDEPARLWSSCKSAVAQWRECILGRAPQSYQELKGRYTTYIFTDASNCGYGAIRYCESGRTEVLSGKWKGGMKKAHINVKEAKALYIALSSFKLRWADIHVVVDNTSVVFALRNACSKSFRLNKILLRILHLNLRILSVSYIQTNANPADWLSRLNRKLFVSRHSPFVLSALARLFVFPLPKFDAATFVTVSTDLQPVTGLWGH